MSISAVRGMLFGVLRRHPARPRRSFADYVALTIARVLTFAVVGGLLYVTYIVEIAGYDDFRKCHRQSTMTRLEWVLRFRPAEDCRSY
jgi:hypothetical protein